MSARLLVITACIVLAHAAFSAYEHLSTMKALGRPGSLPTSITVEALLALALFIPGVAVASKPLQDVTYRGELANRSVDDADARIAYMRPSKRAAALWGDQQ